MTPLNFMHRPLLVVLFLLLGFSVLTGPARAVEDETSTSATLEAAYQQAQSYFDLLEKSEQIGRSRDNWLLGAKNFATIYRAAPNSNYGPVSLFMLGRLHHRMYQHFQTPEDRNEALANYRSVASRYPRHQLADDALYAAGLILQENKEKQPAAELFEQVLNQYPDGDIAPYAKNELTRLGITLPSRVPVAAPRPAQTTPVAPSKATTAQATILPFEYWSDANSTRVVINTSSPVTYQAQTIGKMDKQPRRLYIDFANSRIDNKAVNPIRINDGRLGRIRTGQYREDVVRVVLEVQTAFTHTIRQESNPNRLIIDISSPRTGDKYPDYVYPVQITEGARPPQTREPIQIIQKKEKKVLPVEPQIAAQVAKQIQARENLLTEEARPAQKPADELATRKSPPATGQPTSPFQPPRQLADSVVPLPPVAKAQPDLRATEPPLSLAQQLNLGVRHIVLDPGHGGKDPGALGFGRKEKDIVLAIAKQLAPVLEQEIGCKVTLTREKDIFLPLEERTDIANSIGADLFISLHLNSNPITEVHGLETYYLNLTTSAEAMQVAARENVGSTMQISDLHSLLADIMSNSQIQESSRLAQNVQNSLYDGLQERNFPQVKSLGVKQAPFTVLIGAEMPAILIELAFITNPIDARQIQMDGYQKAVAEELTRGVQDYIHSTTASL